MATAWQILQAPRITRMLQALQDVRLIPQTLNFLERTPIVNVDEAELFARFLGHVQIADIVSDDAKALVYSAGRITTETNVLPNVKHGAFFTQDMINQLEQINAGGRDFGIFNNWVTKTQDNLLVGIRQRLEALIIAMQTDSLAYNRLGIQISGTWGMPSDLKLTASPAWTDPVNSLPVTNVLTQRRYAQVRYGIRYTRVTLSTPAFLLFINSAEFQRRALYFLPPTVPSNILPLQDTDAMLDIAGRILNMDVELYDSRYYSQDVTGVGSYTPFLPLNLVVFSAKEYDNDPTVMDLGNAPTTESIVSAASPYGVIGRFNGPTRGPISYVTTPPDMNPPNLTLWAVQRAFPRKHQQASTATLNVGTVTDTIPSTEPVWA